VHAFTDLGLGGQLVFYILAFLIPVAILTISRYKQVPTITKEETLTSREFWLFIGSLVLLISIIQITFTTSIPVYNKLFGLKLAPPANAIATYTNTQIWIGILLALLSAAVQYFRYKQTEWSYFLKRISIPAVIALVGTIPLIFYFEFNKPGYWLLLFTALFSVIANVQYLIVQLKTKVISWGGSIAHVGFALMMIGILISSYKQSVISINHSGVDLGDGFDHKGKMENILLYKNVPLLMKGYEVTYVGDSTVDPNIYYKVNYVKRNDKGEVIEQFQLHPNAQINPKMGLISSPDTRHYFTHDIYTHVTSVPDKRKDDVEIKATDYVMHKIKVGDTIFNKKSYAVLESVSGGVTRTDVQLMPDDIAVSAHFKIHTDNISYDAEPLYIIRKKMTLPIEAIVPELGVHLFINQVIVNEKKFEIGLAEKTPTPDYIIMKALDFPYINILWIGVIILICGFMISVVKRSRQ
jgi:cytochrome c-type biogenesis protein CcmF